MSSDVIIPARSRPSIRLPRPLWFGLATVVLVIVAVGLQCGVPIYRQQVAIREIEHLRGKVETRPRGPTWLRAWVGEARMKPFDRVVKVRLNGTKTTDATLGRVGWLAHLEWISLADTEVTDTGLADLKRVTGLQELSVNHTQVTDSGLVHLKSLTGLVRLWLDKTRLTDAGLAQIEGLTRLQELSLENTQVTDAGLAHLKRLTRLERLFLERTAVTAGGVKELQCELPRLTIYW